jgi:hypothetical protein
LIENRFACLKRERKERAEEIKKLRARLSASESECERLREEAKKCSATYHCGVCLELKGGGDE